MTKTKSNCLKVLRNSCTDPYLLVAQQLYMLSWFFLWVHMSHLAHIKTHKSTFRLTNETKLKSILMDLIWQKVLRNSCTVPYYNSKTCIFDKKCWCYLTRNTTDPSAWHHLVHLGIITSNFSGLFLNNTLAQLYGKRLLCSVQCALPWTVCYAVCSVVELTHNICICPAGWN